MICGAPCPPPPPHSGVPESSRQCDCARSSPTECLALMSSAVNPKPSSARAPPQVSYVFSDKTGTLTSNEMQLRQIAIGGQAYGSLDYRRVL